VAGFVSVSPDDTLAAIVPSITAAQADRHHIPRLLLRFITPSLSALKAGRPPPRLRRHRTRPQGAALPLGHHGAAGAT